MWPLVNFYAFDKHQAREAIRKMLERLKTKLKRDGLLATAAAICGLPFKWWRRVAYGRMLRHASAKQKFDEIYRKNYWGSAESGSGVGSEVGFTEQLRVWLLDVIPSFGVRKIVDAPCGDFNWMRLVLPQVDVVYFGFDIVEQVIAENKRRHSSTNIHFGVADIRDDELPSCDLLMVRDCLFHLSFDDVDRFLRNISGVDYKYLLTTTHKVDSSFQNSDINTGGFRLIDLFNAPFNFDEDAVIARVDDYPAEHPTPREMVLLAKTDVPEKLFTRFDIRN